MKVKQSMLRAPKNLTDSLSKSSKKFFTKILNNYELEDHHLEILSQACHCLDRIEESRLQIKKDGDYILDRFGILKPHPALKTEEKNKVIFARLIRELGLDIEPGSNELGRPPGLYK
jgi:phage terminase small subunit